MVREVGYRKTGKMEDILEYNELAFLYFPENHIPGSREGPNGLKSRVFPGKSRDSGTGNREKAPGIPGFVVPG